MNNIRSRIVGLITLVLVRHTFQHQPFVPYVPAQLLVEVIRTLISDVQDSARYIADSLGGSRIGSLHETSMLSLSHEYLNFKFASIEKLRIARMAFRSIGTGWTPLRTLFYTD